NRIALLERSLLFGRDNEIAAFDLETRVATPLLDGYAPTYRDGYLFYVGPDATSLYAVEFDPEGLETRGAPVLLAQGLAGGDGYAVGDDGTLVYSLAGSAAGRRVGLEWVTRDGTVEPADERLVGAYHPSIAPDGERVAVVLNDGIYVWDTTAGTVSEIVPPGGNTYRPSWHPDGQSVLFATDRETDTPVLYTVASDGRSPPVRLGLESPDAYYSPDGQWLAYRTPNTAAGRGDIYAIQSDLSGTPIEIAATPGRDYHHVLSPDGRWIAFVSAREEGSPEVSVTSFPEPGRRVPISTNGGQAPKWSKSSRELFYVTEAGFVESVRYEDEPEFRITG
ncbi:MAG: hypothetical protein R3324_22050, partial [Halobacteriales archaeon]|nr:hypothetical protein [Halobacteriales archaeon]